MGDMFKVRASFFAPAPPRSAVCACDPSGTQGASAFNQPVKFDTKSVTDMDGMFEVLT
jgi:hypothetical protein